MHVPFSGNKQQQQQQPIQQPMSYNVVSSPRGAYRFA
jgi:hypothetical protein